MFHILLLHLCPVISSWFLFCSCLKKEAGLALTRVCCVVLCVCVWGMCSVEGTRLTSEQLEFRPYLACQEPVFDAQVLGMGLQGPRHCCLCSTLLSSSINMLCCVFICTVSIVISYYLNSGSFFHHRFNTLCCAPWMETLWKTFKSQCSSTWTLPRHLNHMEYFPCVLIFIIYIIYRSS